MSPPKLSGDFLRRPLKDPCDILCVLVRSCEFLSRIFVSRCNESSFPWFPRITPDCLGPLAGAVLVWIYRFSDEFGSR